MGMLLNAADDAPPPVARPGAAPRAAASAWVRRFAPLVTAGARVLDVACGNGRHLYWFALHGHPVTGVDVSFEVADALAPLAATGGEIVQADLEAGAWPFEGRTFGGVVVTNYLHRPLLPAIAEAVAPGGVLIYETFADGQQTIGRPRRSDFLLQPGELLTLCQRAPWRVVAYEHGFLTEPERFVQRIAAARMAPGSNPAEPARHAL